MGEVNAFVPVKIKLIRTEAPLCVHSCIRNNSMPGRKCYGFFTAEHILRCPMLYYLWRMWLRLSISFFFRDAVLKDYHKMQIQFQFQFYCLHAPNAQYTLLWASEVRFCYLNQRKCIST